MEQQTDKTIECGNCGAFIPLKSKICPQCGVILYEDLAIPNDTDLLEPEPKPRRQPAYTGNPQKITQNTQASRQATKGPKPQRQLTKDDVYDAASPVFIVDFNMPFGSMVGLMVKIALASIPALLILFMIGALFWVILGGVVMAVFQNMRF